MSSLSSAQRPARGLTLLELVVVLTILVALGGLVIQVMPSLIARTHYAKCSATIPDINKIWLTEFAASSRYPSGYDSLIATDGGLFDRIPGEGNARGEVSADTLTQAEVDALAAIGVTTVYDHANGGAGSATFDSVVYRGTGTTERVLADGGEVAVLNPTGPSVESLSIDLDRYPSDTKLLVFGIGNGCTAVGPKGSMVEAPTHFGGEDVMNPENVYQRYIVIFAASESDESAEFVTACSVHPDGFDGAEAHIRAFYEEADGTN